MGVVLRNVAEIKQTDSASLKKLKLAPPDLKSAAVQPRDDTTPTNSDAFSMFPAWGDGLGLIVTHNLDDGRAAHATTGLETWVISSPADLPALADRVSRHIEVVTIITSASKEGVAAARELARRLEARGIEAVIDV